MPLKSPPERHFLLLHRLLTAAVAMGMLLVCAASYAASVAADVAQIWSKPAGYPNAPEPIAADVDLDHRIEIIQVDITNKVSAVDPDTGEVLWETALGEPTLLSPVTGNFLGQGHIEVLVASTNGSIFVLNGATGAIAHIYRSSFTPNIAPVVFPWNDSKPTYREGIILYDPSERTLNGYLLEVSGLGDPVFKYKTLDVLSTPPVVGATNLDAPEPHISFVTNEGAITTFSGRRPEIAIDGHLPNQERTQFGLTLADLNNDDSAELTLRGSLVNEAEDLIHTDVHLVVGVPHFAHTQYLAPMAVGQVIRTIGTAVGAPNVPAQVTSQIMNRAAIVRNEAAPPGDQPVVVEQPVEGRAGDLGRALGNLPQMGGAAATDSGAW
jgi:hypothetical protein